MRVRLVRLAAAVASVLVVGASLSAHAPLGARQQNQAPTFRSTVDLVRLDVSVIDKDRKPIRGLTAADFTVLEDGKPQPVVAFSAVDLADPPPPPVVNGHPVTWMRDIASDVQSNNAAVDKPESRLFVLLIDDVMIPFDPGMAQSARKIAHAVIDKLLPTDRMAVVLTAASGGAQDFTSDHKRLTEAADKMHPGYATYQFGWDSIETEDIHAKVHGTAIPERTGDADIGPRDWSFKTLQSVADAMIAMPERRKILVYISPGIPVNPGDVGAPRIAVVRDNAVIHESNVHLFEEMPDLFHRLQRAGVVIYPVDPSGLDGINGFVERANAGVAAAKGYALSPSVEPDGRPCICGMTAVPPGFFVPSPKALGDFAGKLALDFLLTTANETGGHAIVNTNAPELGVASIFEENASFYLLGYQAPSIDKPGDLHRLTVRVDRKDAEVRTRSGYYTDKPPVVDHNHPAPTPMAKAVASLLPSAALPLKVALAPLAWPPSVASPLPPPKPGKPAPLPLATVTVVLGLERPATDKPISDTVDVQISAFTQDGVARGTSRQLAQVAIRPTLVDDVVHYEALSHIELKPGRYQLRIAAYSGLSDVTGSVFADVDVPDFANDPVSLSGVLLQTVPAAPSAPHDALAALVPIAPTASRAFQQLDRATAWLRVYQGTKAPLAPVTLTTQITNERDERVIDRRETLAVDRFDAATRAADVRVELPLVTLARGQYLLTLQATLGSTSATRNVRFTVGAR